MYVHITDSTDDSTGSNLQHLKNIIITGWPNMKDQLHINIRPYWSYKDDLAAIHGAVMKGRHSYP